MKKPFPPLPWRAEDAGDGKTDVVDATGRYIVQDHQQPLCFWMALVSVVNSSGDKIREQPWFRDLEVLTRGGPWEIT